MTETDTLRVLCALLAVLVAAHGMGAVFARIGLPRVVGEIAGGLLLGPTVLGGLAPSAYAWLFGRGTTSQVALAVLGQLGLVLLMYTSGAATRLEADRESLRRVGVIAAVGLVVPFAAGLAALRVVDLSGYWGAAQSGTAFALVLACALAVTSIPVISRIMADLGILRTGFARTVLGVALVEDVVLYGVVAVALASAAATGPARAPGVPSLLGLEPGSALDIAWHIGATLGLLAGALALARPVQTWAGPSRLDGGPGGEGGARGFAVNPVVRRLAFLLAVTLVGMLLGVQVFLSAFVAGVVVARRSEPAGAAQETIRRFSAALFVPVYFALVGLGLNLRRPLDWGFLAVFLLFACAVKAGSVYLGARMVRIDGATAAHLAVAMNARGGPGIVLATVAFAAGVVDERFYAILVLLAVLTSVLAGWYLRLLPPSAFGTLDAVGAPGWAAAPDRSAR